MSAPTTPRSQREDASSTSSSPRRAGLSSQLTPRSKVKAMLAAFDQESSGAEEGFLTGNASTANGSPKPQGATTRGNRGPTARDGALDEDKSDDAEIVSRPHGRLARMMHGDAHQSHAEPGEDESADDGAAYERVRRRLLQQRPSTASKAAQPSPSRHSESDDDDVRAFPAKSTRRGRANGIVQPTNAAGEPDLPSSRRSSPGLFVSLGPSPARPGMSRSVSDHSDSDLPEDPKSDPQFLAAVEQQRQERQAREAEAAAARKQKEKEEKAVRLKELAKSKGHARKGAVSDSDSAVDQCLTQQARPCRKASKKALEEISRETQRLARNMHLSHEAKTKKKITKQSLFDRFNFKPVGTENVTIHSTQTIPATSSTLASDADHPQSTAPSSPPPSRGSQLNHADKTATSAVTIEPGTLAPHPGDDDLPSMDQILSDLPQPPSSPARAIAPLESREGPVEAVTGGKDNSGPVGRRGKEKKKPKRAVNRAKLRQTISAKIRAGSDSELEIVPVSKAKAVLSEHVPQGKEDEAHSLLVLRACAHLNMPGDRAVNKKAAMTYAEMQAGLRRRARQQALQERLEHLEELKKRGIVPQTAEERAKEEATIEELVEKARKEAEEIQKKEKAAEQKEGKGETEDAVLDDFSDDGDSAWTEEDDEADGEMSGSEEEDAHEMEEDDDDVLDGDVEETTLADQEHDSAVSNAAPSPVATGGNEDVMENQDREGDDGDVPARLPRRRERTTVRVVSDDDGDSDDLRPSVEVPVSVTKPPMPNLPMPEGPVMGLTQIFAGTMADSQPEQLDSAHGAGAQDEALDFLRGAPAPSLPAIEQIMNQATQEMVVDSQPLQSQPDAMEDLQVLPSPTQVPEFPDPTQDVGFSMIISPCRPPPSTIETVLIDRVEKSTAGNASPVKRRGRLQRRMRSHAVSEDEDEDEDDENADKGGPRSSTDAFGILLAEAKKEPDGETFSKKKSRAKEMVEEQAEESEDEYAGLGGASDDGSGEDEDMSDLLDDQAQDVDEEDLAALMADKDRADDKRQIEKLYNDVTTGALRRRRGSADLDLSDSDYDEEARRRMRRHEETKKRRALVADKNVEKIAMNPKKSAFFKSIEDRDREFDDEELDFLDDGPQAIPDSQGDASVIPPVARVTSGTTQEYDKAKKTLKRKRSQGDDGDNDENRAPPYLRGRRQQRPRTTAEIRETLSTLIAPPNAILPGAAVVGHTDDEDDGDAEMDYSEHEDGSSANEQSSHRKQSITTGRFALARQTIIGGDNSNNGGAAPRSRVVNRLSLTRTTINGAAGSAASNSVRMAFHNPSKAGNAAGDEDILPPPITIRRAQAAAKFSSAALRRPAGIGLATASSSTLAISTTTATATNSTTTSNGKNHIITKGKSKVSTMSKTKTTSTSSSLKTKGIKAKTCSVSSFLKR